MFQNTSSKFVYYAAWITLYFFIIGGTTVFATSVYKKYETQHLPSGNIELSIPKSAYQLGEVVEFTITNHFPVPIYVTNKCPQEPLNVYRWNNNSWQQVHAKATDGEDCYTGERNVAIESESARTYNFADWPELFDTPGVYRIAANINHYDDIPFQDFVILEPAKVIEIIEPPQIIYERKVSNPKPVVTAPETIPEITVSEEYREEEEISQPQEREEHEREEDDDD